MNRAKKLGILGIAGIFILCGTVSTVIASWQAVERVTPVVCQEGVRNQDYVFSQAGYRPTPVPYNRTIPSEASIGVPLWNSPERGGAWDRMYTGQNTMMDNVNQYLLRALNESRARNPYTRVFPLAAAETIPEGAVFMPYGWSYHRSDPMMDGMNQYLLRALNESQSSNYWKIFP